MMKLLIVAPNPQLRLLIRGLLAPFASEIYDCGAGAEALAVYRRQEPDCVLIDIDGPPRDGLETSRQIVSAFPEAYIVMLSDDDDAGGEPWPRQREDGYVLKNNLLDLRQRLKSVLQTKPKTIPLLQQKG